MRYVSTGHRRARTTIAGTQRTGGLPESGLKRRVFARAGALGRLRRSAKRCGLAAVQRAIVTGHGRASGSSIARPRSVPDMA
eukprot:3941180-Rhodomonas_salina.2